MKIAAQIIEKAAFSNIMITAAESCTGGMLTAYLTDTPGASAVVERGFVTYTNAAKIEMLGVKSETLVTYGAVSEDVARQMAQGALTASHAQLSISVTGIAGPGGSEHKPEGRVCFGLATASTVHSETVEFGALGRDAVRQAACQHALNLLLSHL